MKGEDYIVVVEFLVTVVPVESKSLITTASLGSTIGICKGLELNIKGDRIIKC